MSELTKLVPPLELCKLIPAGELEDSAALWVFFPKSDKKFHLYLREDIDWSKAETYPAPTFDEILDELHKCQEDVFVKWSETAYHGWLVNAYSHGRNEDYQAHDESKATAALKAWLKMKGIEYAE